MTTTLGLYAVRKLIRKEIIGMTGGLVMTSRTWLLYSHHTQASWFHVNGRPVLLKARRLEYITLLSIYSSHHKLIHLFSISVGVINCISSSEEEVSPSSISLLRVL